MIFSFDGNHIKMVAMEADHDEGDAPPLTVPADLMIQVRGWGDEESARSLGETVGYCVRELSRLIDLSSLDGVTVAGDYTQALLDLDRGYQTNFVLTPSNDVGVGVAMTPSVIRDGNLKSHIVLNGYLAAQLASPESDLMRTALHMLAHECAHVEVTAAFDRCFPNVLLRSTRENLLQACRWDIILACWDEYAVSRMSARRGNDPTEDYEQTFIESLRITQDNADEAIAEYRFHGDHGRILKEVFLHYGRLLKYAAYHLGNLDGHEVEISDRPASKTALQDSWFEPFLMQLQAALRALYASFGSWESQQPFEDIGDIAEEVVAHGGVYAADHGEGNIYVDVA